MHIKFVPLTLSILFCLGVGFLGSYFTMPSIPTWYATLNKPFFSPPNFIFAPVWTTLYILMGVSLYLVWDKGISKKKVKIAVLFFALQLFLNFLWSILFFALHSPILALFEIIILWLVILITIMKFRKVSNASSLLLYPYIAWVSFASILNLSIVILNR